MTWKGFVQGRQLYVRCVCVGVCVGVRVCVCLCACVHVCGFKYVLTGWMPVCSK